MIVSFQFRVHFERCFSSYSVPTFPVKPNVLANPKQHLHTVKTESPHVYAIQGMDPEWLSKDIRNYSKASQLINRSSCAFVPPVSFGYELPDVNNGVPEFAFIGRSNVGKSTLLGALLNNPTIVKTSKTPGCTRTINYYAIFDSVNQGTGKGNTKRVATKPNIYFVDLPGYGYAKAAKSQAQEWQQTMHSFLLNRPPFILRRAFLLVDSRHGLTDTDFAMMRSLDQCGVAYQIVFTKIDLVPMKHQLETLVENTFKFLIEYEHGACLPVVHLLSSKSGHGLEELKGSICLTAQEISATQ